MVPPPSRAVGLAALLLLTVAGCAASTFARPEPALERYRDAAARGDTRALRALQSRDARATFGDADFARGLREYRAELRDQASALERWRGRSLEAVARVTLEDGIVVSLVLEDGHWRIDGGVLGEPVARAPVDAVRSLRTALRLGAYDGLGRILAARPREQLRDQVRTLVEALDDDGTLDVQQSGDRATVRFDGGRLQLVREAGEWHIEEIHLD